MWRSSDGAVARHGGAGRRARVREAAADEGAGRVTGGQIEPEPRDFGSGVTEGDPGDHGRGCRAVVASAARGRRRGRQAGPAGQRAKREQCGGSG